MLLGTPPPPTAAESVTDILHGVPITDPYRWLEDQDSARTREWLAAQRLFARTYLDAIPGRGRVRERIQELLDVDTYDSVQKAGSRYVFRKRMAGHEQPSIFLREGPEGADQLLIDPKARETGNHTAVNPLRLSHDGRLLLYEVKEGGERTGIFELLDLEQHVQLPDSLPRGYLRGFAFGPDARSFYYVHERIGVNNPARRLTAYHHILGTSFESDKEIFCAGDDERLRLHLVPGPNRLGFLVFLFDSKTYTSFYLWQGDGSRRPELLVDTAEYNFGPLLLKDRILAITNCGARNFKIIEVRANPGSAPEFVDLIPEMDFHIEGWAVTSERIFVSYARGARLQIHIFDPSGKPLGELPTGNDSTVRLISASSEDSELLIEQESFITPVQIHRYSPEGGHPRPWTRRAVPLEARGYGHRQIWFSSKDGTSIPMFLVGRNEVLAAGAHPTIMTSYGGFGVPMTPQFSVFVSFLMERGCLFALPNIRGGSEFGADWHKAAKRHKRQTAFDDFISAAEWLIAAGHTEPHRLGIFGGSNSGLLVAAAMTQRPELFRVVVCLAPLLDMLRYHLFDNTHVWREEFGTAADPEDFAALAEYSPYHRVRENLKYPALLMISGDADQSCNALHARKMTARMQAASASEHPILLHYSRFRGHSPVLPLRERIDALTDRVAFVCDQLQLRV